jgi:hypothetical protein
MFIVCYISLLLLNYRTSQLECCDGETSDVPLVRMLSFASKIILKVIYLFLLLNNKGCITYNKKLNSIIYSEASRLRDILHVITIYNLQHYGHKCILALVTQAAGIHHFWGHPALEYYLDMRNISLCISFAISAFTTRARDLTKLRAAS